MSRLQGRVALVTGSSRGIGAAIARLFAAEGAAVPVHCRDSTAIAGVRDEIMAAGRKAIGVEGAVTVLADLKRVRTEIEARLGSVDLLVANAGGNFTAPGPLEETPLEGWQKTIEANLTATFLTLKVLLPGMKEWQRGDIVTISSSAGCRPHARTPIPYASAKSGVQLLTQDVALQAGPFGIRANCIEDNRARIPADVQARLAEQHATQRLGTPNDVARAALFLADREQSEWITGVVIDVHGGA